MKFKNGRKVSQEVYQAVRYVSKVGVITRNTWNELFGKGTLRWKQKQLRLLVEGNIFKPHPCEELVDSFVMGGQGSKMAFDQNWRIVYWIQPQFINHDETVAKGMWRLEQESICLRWLTERELKAQKTSNFKLNIKEGGGKYPDGVMKLSGSLPKVVAIEYEKTSKTTWRYNKAIKAFSESCDFSFILFIVENKAIESSIKRSILFIGDSNLASRIGFIRSEDWKRDPANANIEGLLMGKSIRELV